MPTFKWLAAFSLMGFTVCGFTSLFLPPPANPAKDPARAIGAVIEVPSEAQALLKRSCYDCHSNETRWPVYSRVWPASALIYSDVSKARRVMNFSDWPRLNDAHEARRAAGLLTASCAAIQSGLMPRHRYLALHADARITPEEGQRFCAWSAVAVKAMRKKN